MTKRDVIKLVLDGAKPPYTPWSFKFTQEPLEILKAHLVDVPVRLLTQAGYKSKRSGG